MVIGQMVNTFLFVVYAVIVMVLLSLPVFAFVLLAMGAFFGAITLIVRVFK